MRGWVTHAFNDMRFEELPAPKSTPGWAAPRKRLVEPSVTDAQLFYGEHSNSYDEVKKKLATGPLLLFGREFCAEIAEIEKNNVYGLAAGDGVGATNAEIGTIRFGFPSSEKSKESLSMRR